MNHGYAVYSAYIRPENRDWRVVYTPDTPRNHDIYITYSLYSVISIVHSSPNALLLACTCVYSFLVCECDSTPLSNLPNGMQGWLQSVTLQENVFTGQYVTQHFTKSSVMSFVVWNMANNCVILVIVNICTQILTSCATSFFPIARINIISNIKSLNTMTKGTHCYMCGNGHNAGFQNCLRPSWSQQSTAHLPAVFNHSV